MQSLMTIMRFPKRKMPPTCFHNGGAIGGGGLKENITHINSTCPLLFLVTVPNTKQVAHSQRLLGIRINRNMMLIVSFALVVA